MPRYWDDILLRLSALGGYIIWLIGQMRACGYIYEFETMVDAVAEPDMGYFFLGPYLLGEVRFHIHKQMALLVSVEQDLLIGGTNWINTATQFGAGMIFSIASR